MRHLGRSNTFPPFDDEASPHTIWSKRGTVGLPSILNGKHCTQELRNICLWSAGNQTFENFKTFELAKQGFDTLAQHILYLLSEILKFPSTHPKRHHWQLTSHFPPLTWHPAPWPCPSRHSACLLRPSSSPITCSASGRRSCSTATTAQSSSQRPPWPSTAGLQSVLRTTGWRGFDKTNCI